MSADIAHTPPAMAQANGIELCWDSFGDAAAPALLLIMGLAGQMIAWETSSAAGSLRAAIA